jgi:hypothetical protein
MFRNAIPSVVRIHNECRSDCVAYSINLDDVLKALQKAQSPVVIPPPKAFTWRDLRVRRGNPLKSVKNIVGEAFSKKTKSTLGIENIPIR